MAGYFGDWQEKAVSLKHDGEEAREGLELREHYTSKLICLAGGARSCLQ